MSLTLGERIRQLRLTKGMSQTELGKGLATASMISQIESGTVKPSMRLLSAIAQRLETPEEEFVMDIQDRQPDSVRHQIALRLMELGRTDNAITIWEDLALQNSFVQKKAALMLIKVLFQMRNYTVAEKWVSHLCEQNVEVTSEWKAEVMETAGQGLYEQGEYLLARHYFRQAIRTYSQPIIRLHFRMAQVCVCMDLLDDAVRYLSEGLHVSEQNQSAYSLWRRYIARSWRLLAIVYQQQNRLDQALEAASTARLIFYEDENQPAEGQLWIVMAVIAEKLKRNEDAWNWYDKAIELTSGNHPEVAAKAYLGQAKLAFRYGNHIQLAYEQVSKALQRSNDNPHIEAEASALKGTMLMQEGLPDQAVNEWQKSVERFTSVREWTEVQAVCQQLAEHFFSIGEFQTALGWMERRTQALALEVRTKGVWLV